MARNNRDLAGYDDEGLRSRCCGISRSLLITPLIGEIRVMRSSGLDIGAFAELSYKVVIAF
jgi:hypothetical protein